MVIIFFVVVIQYIRPQYSSRTQHIKYVHLATWNEVSFLGVEGKQAGTAMCTVCNTYFREPVYL